MQAGLGFLCLLGASSFSVFAADVAVQDAQPEQEIRPVQIEATDAPSLPLPEEPDFRLVADDAPVSVDSAIDEVSGAYESGVPVNPQVINEAAAAKEVSAPVPKQERHKRAPAKNVDLKEVVVTAAEPDEGIDPAEEIPAPVAQEGGPEQAPMMLLGSEVLPGTATRLEWSPSVSFMGISAPTAVLVINGVQSGPTLCLTAAVHGDELNGIEIVRRVMYNIDPLKLSGAMIGIPIVNLEGFRAGSRYLSDRRDLNRYFPGNPSGSSASRIAYSFFQEVVSHCDMLIDLHTGSFRRTNLPQLRADLTYPAVENLSREMGAIVVVQSTGAKGSLRRAATERGVPSVTLEAGAPHELQKSAVDYGVKSIESALDGLGLVDRLRFWERAEEPVFYRSTWVRAREGGILISEVELGQNVEEGELLGAVTDPITNQRHEIRSTYSGRVIGMALNQVMHPGFAAYHIGIQPSEASTPDQLATSEDQDQSPAQEMAIADSSLPVQSQSSHPMEAVDAVDEDEMEDEMEDDTMSSFYDIDEESDE